MNFNDGETVIFQLFYSFPCKTSLRALIAPLWRYESISVNRKFSKWKIKTISKSHKVTDGIFPSIFLFFFFWIFSIFKTTGKVRGPSWWVASSAPSGHYRSKVLFVAAKCFSGLIWGIFLHSYSQKSSSYVWFLDKNLQVDHCLFRGMFRISVSSQIIPFLAFFQRLSCFFLRNFFSLYVKCFMWNTPQSKMDPPLCSRVRQVSFVH